MIINKKSVQSLLVAFIPFTSLFTINTYIGDFNYYLYPLCFLLFISYLTSKNFIKLILLLISMIPILVFQKILISYPIFPLLKQIIPIIIIYSSLFYFIRKLGYSVVFKSYLKIAVLISSIGIIQFIIYLFFKNIAISPFGYRVNSIVTEPSHLAIVLMPALIYYLLDFLHKKKSLKSFFIIFICVILTQSLSVFISLVLMLPFIISKKSLLKLVILVSLVSPFLISYIATDVNINSRLTAVELMFQGNYDFMTGQETVYSALTNLEASYYSLSKSYGFGVGMGGHPHSYDLYFSNRPDVYLRESSYGINRLNAHNLFIRSISELGLFFVFLLVVIFSLFRIKNIRQNWIFIASLSYLISRFIKLGGYFDHGLPVFLIVIILIVIENKNKRKYESFVY